jgi:peptide/nickel transport system permease protein
MQALFLFTTVGVLLANLLADMLYGVLDPRMRTGGSA